MQLLLEVALVVVIMFFLPQDQEEQVAVEIIELLEILVKAVVEVLVMHLRVMVLPEELVQTVEFL